MKAAADRSQHIRSCESLVLGGRFPLGVVSVPFGALLGSLHGTTSRHPVLHPSLRSRLIHPLLQFLAALGLW
jgi:hypothetical protein